MDKPNLTLVLCPECGAWQIILINDGEVHGNQITFKFDRRSLCQHRAPARFVSPGDKLFIREKLTNGR